MEIKKTVWVIMSKDRKWVAKGVPRYRCLVEVDDKKNWQRILTYDSKGMAESGFKNNWFYGPHHLEPKDVEAVEMEMILKEASVV